MTNRSLEAIYAVPDDEPVVQLFVRGSGQCGEIRYRTGRLEIELFPPDGESSWVVDAAELIAVIEVARRDLVGKEL